MPNTSTVKEVFFLRDTNEVGIKLTTGQRLRMSEETFRAAFRNGGIPIGIKLVLKKVDGYQITAIAPENWFPVIQKGTNPPAKPQKTTLATVTVNEAVTKDDTVIIIVNDGPEIKNICIKAIAFAAAFPKGVPANGFFGYNLLVRKDVNGDITSVSPKNWIQVVHESAKTAKKAEPYERRRRNEFP